MDEFWVGDSLGALLNKHLQTDNRECPFLEKGVGAGEVIIEHFDGGRDVTYVMVSRGPAWLVGRTAATPTISFAAHVPGTSIIYDLADGIMQGKARPFACDLREKKQRLYALMPYQIESVGIRYELVRDRCRLTIDLRDAAGETIQAALPFQLQRRSLDPTCVVLKDERQQVLTTSREGRYERLFDRPPFSPRSLEFVARSLLNDMDRKAAYEVGRQIIPVSPS